jgi:hypothetical protein
MDMLVAAGIRKGNSKISQRKATYRVDAQDTTVVLWVAVAIAVGFNIVTHGFISLRRSDKQQRDFIHHNG